MQSKGETSSNVEVSGDHATLTISIDGPYFPMAKFRKTLDSFMDLLVEVDQETSDTGTLTVEWAIESIRSGSIHITAVASPVNEDVPRVRPDEVIKTVTRGIEKLQESPIIPVGFSDTALKHAKTFGELIDPDDFAEIRLRSNGWSHGIAPKLAGNIDEITKVTQKFYGSIEGVLVSISLAGKQKFGIRSFVEGKTIQCFFEDDLSDRAKEALGRRVYIFGLIRQRLHGPKINIQVEELRVLPAKEDIPSLNDLLARIRRESRDKRSRYTILTLG